MTSKALTSATSSQDLEAGRWPSGSPECLIARQSGRDRRRASLSLMLGISSDSQIPATSLQPCSTSLQSADRQFYLENRLTQLLANTGSILYSLTWKPKVTSAGRRYFQRAASVRRIGVTDYFLGRNWPTEGRHREGVADLATWTTPLTNDGKGSDYSTSKGEKILKLPGQAKLTAWATCTTRDWKSGGADLEDSLFRSCGKMRNDLVDYQAYLAAYPTPLTVPNSEKSHGQLSGSFRKQMEICAPAIENAVRITASGLVLTGSDAGMAGTGPLNPAHSRWLMGFPPEWDVCAVMAMQSCPRSRRSSSRRGTRAATTVSTSETVAR